MAVNMRKDLKKRRNVWSSEEVFFFLGLIKEKHILGLMDGKRLRVSDIFKTLVSPMEEAEFHRDLAQLTVKWKNLKADNYQCKRHNGVIGNDPADFEFFEALEDILGHRPSIQTEGFDTSQTVEVSLQELQTIENDNLRVVVEIYEDAPDIDRAIPGPSTTPGIQRVRAASREGSPASCTSKTSKSSTKISKSKKKNLEVTYDELKKSLAAEIEQQKAEDTEFFNSFFVKQGEMMLKCTTLILNGLKEIFKPISPPETEPSDEESDLN